jgi:hypothetical protein
MKTIWIRVELPGVLHFKFMEKVHDDFGTFHAQNEAITMILKKYLENPLPLQNVKIMESKGYRVLSQEVPEQLKKKIDYYFFKEFESFKCLSAGIKAVIQLYVNNKINIK